MKGKKIMLILPAAAVIMAAIWIFMTVVGRENEKTGDMPEIVFYRLDISYRVDPLSWRQLFLVDRKGNMYVVRDDSFNILNFEERYEKFLAGDINEEKWVNIGTLEQAELREKYELLKQLAEKEKLIERRIPKAGYWSGQSEQNWFGVYYDEEGRIQPVLIQHAVYRTWGGKVKEYSFLDTETAELTDWIECMYQEHKGDRKEWYPW